MLPSQAAALPFLVLLHTAQVAEHRHMVLYRFRNEDVCQEWCEETANPGADVSQRTHNYNVLKLKFCSRQLISSENAALRAVTSAAKRGSSHCYIDRCEGNHRSIVECVFILVYTTWES